MPSITRTRSLFVTPLIEMKLDGADKLNDALMKEIAARREREAGITRSNRSGWHSEADFFLRKETAHRDLAKRIAKHVRTVTENLASSPADSWSLSYDGWINVNGPGGHNAPHDHPGAFWSGVYYVAVPPKSGAIELMDTRPSNAAADILDAPFFASSHVVRPREGLMILFPSTLKHWVQPNESEADRISIAFNVGVKAKS